ARRAPDPGATAWCWTAGTRGVGAAAQGTLVARTTRPDPPGAATAVAWAKCRTPCGGGREGWPGWPRGAPISRGALEPGGPAGRDGEPGGPRPSGRAGRGAT